MRLFKHTYIFFYHSTSFLLNFRSWTQLTFTFSKSTIETLKKMWNMFKVNNKNAKMTSMTYPFHAFEAMLWISSLKIYQFSAFFIFPLSLTLFSRSPYLTAILKINYETGRTDLYSRKTKRYREVHCNI